MSKRLFIVFLARAALTFGGGFVAMVLFGAAIGVDHGPILLIAFVAFCCLFSLIGGRFDRRRLFITLLIAIAIVSTGCGASASGAPAPNSIAAARATDEAKPAATPESVATTPPAAMAVADAVKPAPVAQRDETMNQAEPGLDRLLATLAVVIGIPVFWMLKLKFFNAIRRTQRAA